MMHPLIRAISAGVIVLSLIWIFQDNLPNTFYHYCATFGFFSVMTFVFMIESKICESQISIDVFLHQVVLYDDNGEIRVMIRNLKNNMVKIKTVTAIVFNNMSGREFEIIFRVPPNFKLREEHDEQVFTGELPWPDMYSENSLIVNKVEIKTQKGMIVKKNATWINND